MKTFEIKAPDGRLLRHQHETYDEARAKVVPGYEIVGEVLGASADGTGGYVNPATGPTLMTTLLQNHGEELKAWLRANLPTLDVKKR